MPILDIVEQVAERVGVEALQPLWLHVEQGLPVQEDNRNLIGQQALDARVDRFALGPIDRGDAGVGQVVDLLLEAELVEIIVDPGTWTVKGGA